jgi:aspartyl-tRNA synthetase
VSKTVRNSCGAIRATNVGERVELYGWVHRRRDHGGLIFIDLRDRSGIIQATFNPAHQEAHQKAAELRLESVIHASGTVRRRPTGSENAELATGEVEVEAEQLVILNRANTPPFAINDESGVDEQLRLRFRYLDLRRPRMARNLSLRHRLSKAIRDFLDQEGFLEIETPVLIRSTPEGARDYLVPSRLNPGHVYALAQSPQLYKQLLMVAGTDRYFQIVRCYRDEDQRADRQPEFTQLDLEMSFVGEDDVMDVIERAFAYTFERVLGVPVTTPIQRMTHAEAMARYGVDKPDLRYGLEIVDLTPLFKATEFKIFRQVVDSGGAIKAIRVPGAAGAGAREIDGWTEVAKAEKAKGLAFWHLEAGGWRSPIAKFFSEGELAGLRAAVGAEPGDLVLAVADRLEVVSSALGAVRKHVARQQGLVPEGRFEFVWVTDFPLFERSTETGEITAAHHPFTSPRPEDLAMLSSEPLRVRARAYDLVLNGTELGSGSIRIHDAEMQQRVFAGLGMSREEAEKRFGFLLEAFGYGAPPHGGFAFGLDRVVMIAAGEETIREVMAFPKNQQAEEVMTGAPAPADPKQLRDLGLELKLPPKKGQS